MEHTIQLPEGHKLCNGPCGRIMPATTEYFKPRANGTGQGVQHQCRDCESAERKAARDIKRRRTLADIRAAGLTLIEKELEQAGSIPHSAHLVQALFDACGGVRGYAAMVMDQYFESEKGKYGRTRILELIARLTVQNTAAGGARKPVELLSDEELAARRQELIGKALDIEHRRLGMIEEDSGADPT